MAISVPNPTQHDPAASAAHASAKPAVASQKPAPAQPQPVAKTHVPVDTVHISNAAQSALQEATETQLQTAKEARGGDRQAQRLLAKETAAKKA
jgi:hypothetical protein